MQGIFSNHPNCIPYMDDLVVFSNTWEDHLEHIHQTLHTLEEAGLTANPTKGVWGGPTGRISRPPGGGREDGPARTSGRGFYNIQETYNQKRSQELLGSGIIL